MFGFFCCCFFVIVQVIRGWLALQVLQVGVFLGSLVLQALLVPQEKRSEVFSENIQDGVCCIEVDSHTLNNSLGF